MNMSVITFLHLCLFIIILFLSPRKNESYRCRMTLTNFGVLKYTRYCVGITKCLSISPIKNVFPDLALFLFKMRFKRHAKNR